MRMKYKLMRNAVFNYGIQFWSVMITFIMMPIIIADEDIGIEGYGIYLLVTALTGYFSLLDLGIGTSLVKFVSEYHVKGEKEKVNGVVNTAFFIFLGVGAVGAIGLFILGTFFIDVFKIEAALLWEARLITFLLAAAFISGLSMSIFKGVLAGMQRYNILAYISFAMSLVNVAVVIWILLMGYGIVELVLYTLCFGLIGHIITAWYAKKALPYLEIKRTHLNKTMVKTLFNLSMLVMLLFAFGQIVFYTDTIVIGFFLGATMITFYAAARKLYSIPARIVATAMQAIIPAASELDVLQKKKAIQMLFLRVAKYCLALLFLLALPMMFMSKYILVYWIDWAGGNFALYYLVTNILLISIFLDYFNHVSMQILIGMNKIKLLVTCYGIVAILNLILSIIFVQRIGLEGVALGTTIPFIVLAPVFMWNAFNILGINWRDYVKNVLLTNIPYACCVGIVLYSLITLHPPASLIEIVVYYAIGMLLYFLLFYFLALNEEERTDLKRIFSIQFYREVQDEI